MKLRIVASCLFVVCCVGLAWAGWEPTAYWDVSSDYTSADAIATGPGQTDTDSDAAADDYSYALAQLSDIDAWAEAENVPGFGVLAVVAKTGRDQSNNTNKEGDCDSYAEIYASPYASATLNAYMLVELKSQSSNLKSGSNNQIDGFAKVKLENWTLEVTIDEVNDELDWELYDGTTLDSSGSVSSTYASGWHTWTVYKIKSFHVTEDVNIYIRADSGSISNRSGVDHEFNASGMVPSTF